jgi:hypothetical protein
MQVRELLADHEETVTDIYVVNRGSLIELDVRLSYPGVKSVAELDEIRASVAAAIAPALGRTRIHVVFTDKEIDDFS